MAQDQRNRSQWLNPDFPQSDAREVFAQQTASSPLPVGAEVAFMSSKLQILRTHPVAPRERQELVRDFLDKMPSMVPEVVTGPEPGGVGYGMFYEPTFKTAFVSGTGLAWGIVCPVPPGGNVSDWLYLTGMNRASMGCEAFVAYHGQNDVTFNVFDWSRSPKWQIHTPLSNMKDYVGTIVTNGTSFPVVQLINLTYQNDQASWINEIQLLNQTTGVLDLCYRYLYPATFAQQTTPSVGSWAAIVETFQPAYAGTNAMGCLNAKITSRGNDGTWGPWNLLDPTQATLRIDNKGFHQLFLDQEYSWAVGS